MINKNIQSFREASGLSQEAVAKKIGKTRNFISLIENGKSTPSLGTLEDLADLFQCRVIDFFVNSDSEIILNIKDHPLLAHALQNPKLVQAINQLILVFHPED